MTKNLKVSQPTIQEQYDGFKFQLQNPEYASALVCNYLQLNKDASQEHAVSLFPPIINQMAAINQGDLTEVERILYAQSVSLQTAFNRFMSLSGLHQDNLERCDRFANLALRAQEQCRKTLATLIDIKNPKKPTQFIKNYVDKQLNQLRVDDRDTVNPQMPLQLESRQNAKVDI